MLFFLTKCWVTSCQREIWLFTFTPGGTLIILSDVWYQEKCQICYKCVFLSSKNTDEVKTTVVLVTAPDSLPILWERKTEATIFILFSMAAELWARSPFASSNNFKHNRVLFQGSHSSCQQACVHNVLCTAHFWLYSCRLSSCCWGFVFKGLQDYMWMISWCKGIETVCPTAVVVKLHSICTRRGL